MQKSKLKLIIITLLALSLTGCMYWLRAYQTYLQMSEFDRYFSVSVADEFTLHFKEPILFNQDFVSLSHLYASDDSATPTGRRWRYWFRKVDANDQVIKPEIKFYADMDFNKENKLVAWSFSKLFLEIAPPKFLEVSLRSIAGAEIDKEKQQLRAKSDLMTKINDPLPQQAAVVAKLGAPIEIKDEPDHQVYVYRFLLETHHIEEGYEKNAINEVKLSFDKTSHELFNMAGNFAGLKVSINYRNFLNNTTAAR
ncbi:hypothetical protein JCM14076_02060 [Methylosoma difficile]